MRDIFLLGAESFLSVGSGVRLKRGGGGGYEVVRESKWKIEGDAVRARSSRRDEAEARAEERRRQATRMPRQLAEREGEMGSIGHPGRNTSGGNGAPMLF